MSGVGAPQSILAAGAAAGLRVVVVSASWHAEITVGLRGGAVRALQRAGVTDIRTIEVPGCFELPVAASRVATADPELDAIVALGLVLRGQTPHFDYVCMAATTGLTEVSVRSGIPIGFGVLTCDSVGQAMDRAGLPGSREDKGGEAVDAALATALALRAVRAVRAG